jgi:hypothetical protein
MPESVMLIAVFREVDEAADGVEKLHQLGVPDADVNVISGIPIPGRVLGRPTAMTNVSRIALVGAALGVAFGLFLLYGTAFLYPLQVGAQPVYPVPMGWITTFEMGMLGLMLFAFLGMFVDSGFPSYTPKNYVPEISDGKIAVLFRCDLNDERRFGASLSSVGAASVKRAEARQL